MRSNRAHCQIKCYSKTKTCLGDWNGQIEGGMDFPKTDRPTDNRIGLISTDFDGTLVGSKAGEEGLEHFFELIRNQRKLCNLQWVINTGRSWDGLIVELQRRNFPILPDWVVAAEREVHRIQGGSPLPDDEWNKACREVHARLFVTSAPFWEELSEFITNQTRAEALRDEYSPITIQARDEEEADQIHCFIKARLPSHPPLIVARNTIYFRFSHESFNKGSCLQRIQKVVGVGAEQTFVVGDHYNDIPMLDSSYAQYIACPANAIHEIKTHVANQGGFVAKHPEASGVVEALTNFLKV